jgi:septal ring factor EnvC (AmiA/AmiB activator)
MKRIAWLPVLLGLLGVVVIAGCAGTQGGGDLPNDPQLIKKEISQIDQDIANTEEMLKGSRAELQIEDSQTLRDEIRSLDAKLAQLHSQKKALEQRLREIEKPAKY